MLNTTNIQINALFTHTNNVSSTEVYKKLFWLSDDIDFDAVIFELPKILVRYLFFDETFVHSGLTLKSDGKKSIVTVTDVTTELVA